MTDARLATDGHLTPESLAELDEGLLDEPATLSAQHHLADCSRCTALHDELRGVTSRLAEAGGADVMPQDVADRLDAALDAALAAERAAGTGAGTATVVPLDVVRRPPRGLRLLQVAAVLVVLLAGAGIAVTGVQGGGGSESGSAADSAAEAEKPVGGSSYPVSASGRNWSEDSVPQAVPRLVAGGFGPVDGTRAQREESGGDARALADSSVDRLAGGPPLAECVTALNDGPVTPLAVDLARWKGQPAAVIVLPTPDDPATVDAWVVGPDCSQADAKVLYFARVARP